MILKIVLAGALLMGTTVSIPVSDLASPEVSVVMAAGPNDSTNFTVSWVNDSLRYRVTLFQDGVHHAESGVFFGTPGSTSSYTFTVPPVPVTSSVKYVIGVQAMEVAPGSTLSDWTTVYINRNGSAFVPPDSQIINSVLTLNLPSSIFMVADSFSLAVTEYNYLGTQGLTRIVGIISATTDSSFVLPPMIRGNRYELLMKAHGSFLSSPILPMGSLQFERQ